jgi:hypothetical protein
LTLADPGGDRRVPDAEKLDRFPNQGEADRSIRATSLPKHASQAAIGSQRFRKLAIFCLNS